MARTICVLNPIEAWLVSRCVSVSCSGHKHVTRDEARLMVLGTMKCPEKDPDYHALEPNYKGRRFISQAWNGVAYRLNDRQIVLYSAEEWQVRGGVKQLLPLGATRQRPRRTKMHIRKPVYATLTQCADNNRELARP